MREMLNEVNSISNDQLADANSVGASSLYPNVVQIGDTYVRRTPLTDKATVMGVWIFYTLFVLIAFAVEKIGTRGESRTS